MHDSLLINTCSPATNRVPQVRKDLRHPSIGSRALVRSPVKELEMRIYTRLLGLGPVSVALPALVVVVCVSAELVSAQPRAASFNCSYNAAFGVLNYNLVGGVVGRTYSVHGICAGKVVHSGFADLVGDEDGDDSKTAHIECNGTGNGSCTLTFKWGNQVLGSCSFCFDCADNTSDPTEKSCETGAGCCLKSGAGNLCMEDVPQENCALLSGTSGAEGTTCAEVECVAQIPTVSEWGLIVMTLIGLTAGTILFARRRPKRVTGMA